MNLKNIYIKYEQNQFDKKVCSNEHRQTVAEMRIQTSEEKVNVA